MPIPITFSCCRVAETAPDYLEGQTIQGTCPKCGVTAPLIVPYRLSGSKRSESGHTRPPTGGEPSESGLTSRALWLFGCVAKVAIKNAGNSLIPGLSIGDWVIELWNEWHHSQSGEKDKQATVIEIGNADPDEVHRQLEALVADVAAALPPDQRARLVTLLTQIPHTIRRSIATDDTDEGDGTGGSLAPGFQLRGPDDLAALLPTRVPRFRPGDRPPGIGDWQLVELIGSGGYGEVWRATNPNLASAPPVALKFCLDKTVAAKLRNEAAMLGQVMHHGRHPGIVSLLHTYLSADPPCLEYELVNGGDLAQAIRELHATSEGPGPKLVAQATDLMGQLFGAVAFAHRLNPPVVHRDLKPANILAQRSARGKVTVRVSDFGIGAVASARSLAGAQGGTKRDPSATNMLRGSYTPLYASPQQAGGERPEPSDDVYSLGVIWFQMLTGDLKAGCPTGAKWADKLASYGMSKPLVDLLGSCIEAERADRPANAGVLADRLAAIRRAAMAATATATTPNATTAGEPVVFTGHTNWVDSVACSADGRFVVSGSGDKSVRVWETATQEEVKCLKGHSKTVRSVVFSADGKQVISGSYDHTARIWDVSTGRQVSVFGGHSSDVMAVAFLPGGRALSGSKDQTARVWDVTTGKEVLQLGGDTVIGPVWFAVPSPDGKLALTNDPDTALALWDLASGECLRLFEGHKESVWAAAFSPDGRVALSAGSDKALVLWGVENGRELARFKGHTKSVWCVAFSPDGRLAASGGYDKTVRVWDVASGREVHRFEGHTGYVLSVAFTPDGRGVLSASRDKSVRLWELPVARAPVAEVKKKAGKA